VPRHHHFTQQCQASYCQLYLYSTVAVRLCTNLPTVIVSCLVTSIFVPISNTWVASNFQQMLTSGKPSPSAADILHRLLHQDASLGAVKGQTLKCQWWLYAAVKCIFCYLHAI
jgi:hypothetical protein